MIGTKVKHNIFGIGAITAHEGAYITVDFGNKTIRFVYPDAFEKFLTAEDCSVHESIVSSIKAAKEEAEQKKRAEEAARKAIEEERRAAAAIVPTKAKKNKSIDEMFAPDYHVEMLARQPILTYEQVEEQFGIKITGFGRGINPTIDTVVLVSSIGRSRGNFVYHDKWTANGEYIYSGEGKCGDQLMTKGNLAIKNAARDGRAIHLFVKFSPQEYYYQGIFQLIGYTYEDDKDEYGNIRKEYKFRLRKVQG